MQLSYLTRFGAAAALVAALAGCDWFAETRLVPGQHTEADVRKLMGQPEMIWEDDSGARTLEYPRGPEGAQTYMVRIAPDGKLVAMDRALTETNFSKVRPGMTKDDVRRLLGKPTEVRRFDLKNEEVWAWKYRGEHDTPYLFDVHFDVGGSRVKQVSRNRDPNFGPG